MPLRLCLLLRFLGQTHPAGIPIFYPEKEKFGLTPASPSAGISDSAGEAELKLQRSQREVESLSILHYAYRPDCADNPSLPLTLDSRYAKALGYGPDTQLRFSIRWSGLRGRHLVSRTTFVYDYYPARDSYDDKVHLELTLSIDPFRQEIIQKTTEEGRVDYQDVGFAGYWAVSWLQIRANLSACGYGSTAAARIDRTIT
jgi:hypothetical protein